MFVEALANMTTDTDDFHAALALITAALETDDAERVERLAIALRPVVESGFVGVMGMTSALTSLFCRSLNTLSALVGTPTDKLWPVMCTELEAEVLSKMGDEGGEAS